MDFISVLRISAFLTPRVDFMALKADINQNFQKASSAFRKTFSQILADDIFDMSTKRQKELTDLKHGEVGKESISSMDVIGKASNLISYASRNR